MGQTVTTPRARRLLPGHAGGRLGLGGLLAGRASCIMLDPGATGVRACQLVRRRGRFSIRDLLRVELPAPEPKDNADASVDALAELLRRAPRLIRQARFTGHDVGLVVPAGHLQFHNLNISEAGLRQHPDIVQQALKFEIAREQRSDAVEVEVRHWRLPAGQNLRHNVMAVALSGVLARRWHRQFAEAGLRLRQLCVAPCALARLAAHHWPPEPRDLWGVIDLGARQSTLTAVVGEVIAYVRGVTGTAEQWTRRISEGLDISPAEAERIKRLHGIAQHDASLPPDSPSDRPSDIILGLLRDRLEVLAQEIERCFSYVLSHYAAVSPARLVLSGGAAATPGLAAYLSRRLSVPVVVLGDVTEGPYAPDAAAAIGAALLDVEEA